MELWKTSTQFCDAIPVPIPGNRLQRWSFFYNDGMVMIFFQGTIVIDGFSMVLPSLDHHHWMFLYSSTIEIDGFSMVFPNSGAMVSDGFDLEKDLKMRKIMTNLILRQLCVSSGVIREQILVNKSAKSEHPHQREPWCFVEVVNKVSVRDKTSSPQHSRCSYASGALIRIYFHPETAEK